MTDKELKNYKHEWYLKNVEKVKLRVSQWKKANQDKVKKYHKEYNKEWNKTHKAEKAKYNRKNYLKIKHKKNEKI